MVAVLPWLVWVSLALSGLHNPAPPVTVLHASCPYYAETSCADSGTVWLEKRNRLVLLHELGHSADFAWFSPADRIRATRLMGMRGPWGWQGDPWDGRVPNPPMEAFADAYAGCLRGRQLRGAERTVAVSIPGKRWRAICTLTREASAR